MSGSSINIGGVNFGTPAVDKNAPDEPKQAATPEPANPTGRKSRDGFELVTASGESQRQSGKTIHFAAWTDTPTEWPYSLLCEITAEGGEVESVSLGRGGNAYIDSEWSIGKKRFQLGGFLQDRIQSEAVNDRHPKKIRFFPHGGVLISYASPANFCAGYETSAVPSGLTEGIKMLEDAGLRVMDVALDSNFRWVMVTDKRVGWSKNVPAELIKSIQHFHRRKQNIIAIPHFEGDSWFIKTESSWYSANLPQQLYKMLSPQTEVHALAISPDGHWLVQYQK